MPLPDFSMRDLLEAGAHFGHQTHRWNPKMDRYIFGSRSNIHIIDLSQTVPLIHQALVAIREVAAKGGRILFVGSKRQAAAPIAAAAARCAQYYVNHRWLGGTLTNWRTVSGSIARLREIETILEKGGEGRLKKELVSLDKERVKLERSLGGIKDMHAIPDILFVVDTNKEALAILEARKLNIPVIAVLDTNSDPDGITYPIPGNDDAARAIDLYCTLVADSVLDGLAAGASAAGYDLGSAEHPSEPNVETRQLTDEETIVNVSPSDSPLRYRRAPRRNGASPFRDFAVNRQGDVSDRAYYWIHRHGSKVLFEASTPKDDPTDITFRWSVAGGVMIAFTQVLAEAFSVPELEALHIDIFTPNRVITYEQVGVELTNGAFESACVEEAGDAFGKSGFVLRAYASERSDFDFVVSIDTDTGATLMAAQGTLDRVSRVANGIDRILTAEIEALAPSEAVAEPVPAEAVTEISVFEAADVVSTEQVS